MKTIVVIAIAVLGVLLGSWLFPREVQVLVPGPPVKPDTVEVVETDTAAVREYEAVIERQRRRIADLENQQPPENTVVTVYVPSKPDTVDVCQGDELAPKWYVNDALAGKHLGDEASITATQVAADTSGVHLRQETALVYATGPLMGVHADSGGYSLLFDPDGFPKPGCTTWCVVKWVLGATAGGIIIGSAF